MESVRRNDFPGEGLWRGLGLAFHRSVTPALRRVCVEGGQRGVRMHTRLPAQLRCFTPRHYRHLTVSALPRSERETTYRHLLWSKPGFFQAAQNHFF